MDFDRMLRYCALLERNNNRTWFHDRDNHALYAAAKEDFTELLLDLKFRLSEVVDPELGERLLFADPLREDTVVYSGDVSLIQYVAFDGIAAEVQQEEEVIAPEGTTRVDFIFNDTSFPIPNAKIPDNAFKTMELDTVILSGGIAAIGRRAFDETTINTLIAMGVTPPYLNGEIESRNVGIMVVPDVAVEVYGKRYNEMNITDMSSYIEGLF